MQPLTQTVGADVLKITLDNLQPSTTYVAQVIPLYADLTGKAGFDEKATGTKLLSTLITHKDLYANDAP